MPHHSSIAAALAALAVFAACSEDDSVPNDGGTGGSAASGGASASGGVGGSSAAASGGMSGSGATAGTGTSGGTGGATDGGEGGPAPAETTFLAADTSSRLVKFRKSALASIDRVAITGLETGERIAGFDMRFATGALYALGITGRLYTIDPTTGVAVQIGDQIPTFIGVSFAFDFNAVVDDIRAMNNLGQNMRLNPETAAASLDVLLTYAAGDTHAGEIPVVTGCAYLPGEPDAGTTTLYAIDSTADVLLYIDPPNAGSLHTIGPLGVDASLEVGFDILEEDGNITAYAVIQPAAALPSALYSINLSTGAATSIGIVGGAPLTAMTVMP